MPTIHLVTSDIFLGDAIGNFTISLGLLLSTSGFQVKTYARYYNAELTPEVLNIELLDASVAENDLLFAEYSIFEHKNATYRSLNATKIVYYHGITPSEYFVGIDDQTEKNCREGVLQASHFATFDFFMANSEYMLKELLSLLSTNIESHNKYLANSHVFPPVLGLNSRFSDHTDYEIKLPFERYVLYVGRIAPHKNLEDLLHWFYCYQQLDDGIGLVVIGGDAPINYGNKIRALAGQLFGQKESVYFTGHVIEAGLASYYRAAEAFVTLSEHEGFCIPLVEAMGERLPVFAKAAAAIPETLGESTCMLRDQSLEQFAGQVFEVLQDDTKKEAMVYQQSKVYRDIVSRSDGQKLLEIIRRYIRAG